MKKVISIILVVVLVLCGIQTAFASFEGEYNFQSIRSGNVFYLAANENVMIVYGNPSYISRDGVNFKQVDVSLSSVVCAGDTFFGLSGTDMLQISHDGENWQTLEYYPVTTNINMTTMYFDGENVLVWVSGGSGASIAIYNKMGEKISENAIVTSSFAYSTMANSIVKKGDLYYCVLRNDMFSSSDLITWDKVGTGQNSLIGMQSIILTEERFYGINSNYLAYSDDGINWTKSDYAATAITKLNNGSVAAYNSGEVYETDGESTAVVASGIVVNDMFSLSRFSTVGFMDDLYVFIDNKIYKTSDGAAAFVFNAYSENKISTYRDICYGNGVFVAAGRSRGNGEVVSVSSDGRYWTEYVISDKKVLAYSI